VKLVATAAGGRRKGAGIPRAFHGMVLAHVGMAVLIVGVTVVKGYESQKDVRMEAGDTVEVGGYVFRFDGVANVAGANYTAARATIRVTRSGEEVTTLYPAKRSYFSQRKPMTESAIDSGFTRDLYATLGDELNATTWIVRVQHKPFVNWIWGGALLMALGGLFAASDRRYRLATRGWREAQYATAARELRATPEVAAQQTIPLKPEADNG
jgi:cytochrome c-type biogenesis protein CcmF